MGCYSSKSVAATEPLVNAPTTLLTSDTLAAGKGESRSLASYVADVGGVSDSEVRAALEGLSVVEQKKLADAIDTFDSVTSGVSASAKTEPSSLEVLKNYLTDASAASESELTAALQGLAFAERKRLVEALNSLLVMDTEPPAPDVGKIDSEEVVDAPALAELGVLPAEIVAETGVAKGDLNMYNATVAISTSSEPVAIAKSPQASAWVSCCTAQTETTTEFAT